MTARLGDYVEEHRVKLATGFVRYCALLAAYPGQIENAAEVAKTFAGTTPVVERVLKAATAAGTTSDSAWAAPLLDHSAMVAQFLELLRPATILGRLIGVRPVPFNELAILQSGGSSAAWVGESLPIPASAEAFVQYRLDPHKLAALVIVTRELQRFADPASLAALQRDLIVAIGAAMDRSFIDPSLGATSARPASVTHGITPRHSTGATIAAITADLTAAAQSLINTGSTLANASWVLHPTTALYISTLRTTDGVVAFPGLSVLGGVLLGMPCIVSAAAEPSGSPGEFSIALIDGNRIVVADANGLTVEASGQGSIQMSDAPASPATQTVSMFQSGLVALRAVRYLNWTAMPNAVALIDNIAY